MIIIRKEIKRFSSGAKITTEHTQLILLPPKHQKRSFFKAMIPQGPGQQGKENDSEMWAQEGRDTSRTWPLRANPHPTMGEAGNRTSTGSELGSQVPVEVGQSSRDLF